MVANKKKKQKKRATGSGGKSTSGFGGAAVEPCPCGSELPHNKCCGLLHNECIGTGGTGKSKSDDVDGEMYYRNATPEQVVRARYSAYANRVVDFIARSTHPLNRNFESDVGHRKRTIESNSYDDFVLTGCDILETSEDTSDGGTAKVKFVARMTHRETGEKAAFVETSAFEREALPPTTTGGVVEGNDQRQHQLLGPWLYRDGVLEAVPEDNDGDNDNVDDGAD